MSNNGADIFLVLLRPTRVPVVGEAASEGFQGQILVETLNWKLHNEDERKSASKAAAAFTVASGRADKQGSNELRAMHAASDDYQKRDKRLQESFAKAQRGGNFSEVDWKAHQDQRDALGAAFNKKLESIARDPNAFAPPDPQKAEKAATLQGERDKQYADLERNRNFEFTFTKRVDIASTQMLNSMKAGNIFPSGTLTIHRRSATFLDGTSLIFTIQKIRLLEYELDVVVNETMTEMMEKWTCEFGSLAYVYKNPPSHYSHSNTGQAVAKTASQNTTRAFTMKNIGSPV